MGKPIINSSPQERRFVICSGVAHYPHLIESDLPAVEEETKRVATHLGELGYERVLAELGDSPTKDVFEKKVGAWLTEGSRGPADFVVLYHSGHGIYKNGRHYLLFSDFEEGKALDIASLAVERLARWILEAPRFEQTLVIIDTCYAGRGADDFLSVATRLSAFLPPDDSSGFFVLAATRPWEQASQNAFALAFTHALANESEQLGGPVQEFLYLDAILGHIQRYLADHHPQQRARLAAISTDRCRLFPNPKFDRRIPLGIDREAQRDLDFADHWVPRAQGEEIAADAWNFRGRERVLREIVTWITAKALHDNVRIVTGSAGVGKSALLARLVTLSDPEYRQRTRLSGNLDYVAQDTIPPEGIVTAAIHARRQTLQQLVKSISNKLKLEAGSPDELLRALGSQRRQDVIVIDALDEAVQPLEIVTQLLSRFGNLDQIKLLVGSRRLPGGTASRAVPFLSDDGNEIDLDLPEYLGPRDITAYVEHRLLATSEPLRNTPYRNQQSLAQRVAAAVAEKAAGNFLVARIVSGSLTAAADPVNPEMRGWQESFPGQVFDAFDQFLDRLDDVEHLGINKRSATDLLRPLAYAEGQGLPREGIWVDLANALTQRNYTDGDVSRLLEYAGAYVIETLENGRSAYRLYHQALADYLRQGRDEEQTQRRVTETLIACTPDLDDGKAKNWSGAHPYIRSHLATHAARAGVLPDLIVDPRFLVATSPDDLLPYMGSIRTTGARSIAASYREIYHHMRLESDVSRISYLLLAAMRNGADVLLPGLRELNQGAPWAPVWTNTPKAVVSTVAAEVPGGISAYAIAPGSVGEPIAAIGSEGHIELWNLASSTQVCRSAQFAGTLRSLAVVAGEHGGMWIVGAWNDNDGGTLRVLDFSSMHSVRERRGTTTAFSAFTESGRSFVAAVQGFYGGEPDSLQILSVPELDTVAVRVHPHVAPVFSIASVSVGDRRLIISGGDTYVHGEQVERRPVRVWSFPGLQPEPELTLEGPKAVDFMFPIKAVDRDLLLIRRSSYPSTLLLADLRLSAILGEWTWDYEAFAVWKRNGRYLVLGQDHGGHWQGAALEPNNQPQRSFAFRPLGTPVRVKGYDWRGPIEVHGRLVL